MAEQKINKLIPITGVLIFVLGLSLVALLLVRGGGTPSKAEAKRLSSAQSSARYLRDLENMILANDTAPGDLDTRWRWARQEADDAKQAGFDKEVTDSLYCSLAGYGAYIAAGAGLVEGHDCLTKAEKILRERYGK